MSIVMMRWYAFFLYMHVSGAPLHNKPVSEQRVVCHLPVDAASQHCNNIEKWCFSVFFWTRKAFPYILRWEFTLETGARHCSNIRNNVNRHSSDRESLSRFPRLYMTQFSWVGSSPLGRYKKQLRLNHSSDDVPWFEPDSSRPLWR